MTDNELIQAIERIMDAKLEPMRKEIADVKAELTEKIDAVKEETIHQMLMLYELKIKPSIELLAEGHQSILERTVSREEYELTKEEFNDRLIVLEITAKSTVREIEKLKKAT